MQQTETVNKGELKKLEKKLKELADEKRTVRSRQDLFKEKIDALNAKLREAKADRKQNERETKALEAIATMKRMFPGVHGRLTELIKVTQKKYELAVITVLGREADAVVVEDAKTAKECIQYLKEQRIQSMQFIPLKEIKVQAINERLRHLGGSSRLIVDVLQFDKSRERAILFACGDTVVCDTHAEAKKLAFGGAATNQVSVAGWYTCRQEWASHRWFFLRFSRESEPIQSNGRRKHAPREDETRR